MKMRTAKHRRLLTFAEWAKRLLHELTEVRNSLANLEEQVTTLRQQQTDMAAAITAIGGDVQQVETQLADVTTQLEALKHGSGVDLQPIIDANVSMLGTLGDVRGKLEATPPAQPTTPPTG